MTDFFLVVLFAIVFCPLLIAVASFISWQNGFRVLGVGYIVRMIIFAVGIGLAVILVSGGGL
ncbi:hypothetical protein EXW94_24005 [Enterobacter sp. JMULE2]|uniref:hypothetical protein n=1 Tax=Enterobacter sp. JMULE2 TaxID=2518340 RepID=UPI001575BA1B|nr:hypothetical protein [Enterobacter sp. JMULE2]NTZ40682.1 hypothetical protein [Enterobacter sp. JMULE2]